MYRRILSVFIIGILAVTGLIGCEGNNSKFEKSAAQETIDPKSYDLEIPNSKSATIVEAIDTGIVIQMPSIINEKILNDKFKITADQVNEFYGKMCIDNSSIDTVLACKPKDKEAVKSAMNTYIESIKSQDNLSVSNKAKIGGAKIIEKNDYLVLVIIGDQTKGIQSEVAKAEGIINEILK